MEVANYSNYRDLLKETLQKRSRSNTRYSLRAFARDLKLTPSRLSEILNSKRNISLQLAMQIAQRLSFNEEETHAFCDLVLSTDARSEKIQKMSRLRLRQYLPESSEYVELKENTFKAMSEWQHFAILELTFLEGFQSNAKWIAKALGISILDAQISIDRLLKLGLLQKTSSGTLQKAVEKQSTTCDVPSSAIQNFNRQILQKAEAALATQSVHERDFSTMTMCIDPSQMATAKQDIKKFRRSFTHKMESGAKKEVYCLAIQYFKLTDNLENKKS